VPCRHSSGGLVLIVALSRWIGSLIWIHSSLATRSTYAFSKKLENLVAAAAIHIAVYNFCRMHSTIRCTPAMAAGVIDRLWSMDDLYSAVTTHARETAAKATRDRRIQRLIDRLQSGE
jgi:hypothetical protein